MIECRRLDRPVILVGLPGAGKSTVGRAVADRLGCGFVDFDAELMTRTGHSIPQLFASQGEAAFRKLEYQLTSELVSSPPMIWAPGGGWIAIPGVVALVRPPACIIHLTVSAVGALARLRRDATIRPLLAGDDPQVALDRLWDERASSYAQADWTVDTERLDFEQVVDRVADLAGTDPTMV